MTLLCRYRILGSLRTAPDGQQSLPMTEIEGELTETTDANGRVAEEDEESVYSDSFECEESL